MIDRVEIERLRYLNDPRKAAMYLGIPEVIVEDVWAEMRRPLRRANDLIFANQSTGDNRHLQDRQEATVASTRLRRETLRAIIRWADCNGVTVDDAAGFLLSGKAPHREAA